jgi:peptide/nickel transport system permease protein
LRHAAYRILALPFLVLAAGLLGATLIRIAPGFDVDERELDPRLSDSNRAMIRQERGRDNNIVKFYGNYLRGAIHGDLGQSRLFARPVTDLVKERLPVTLHLAGWGLLTGWTVGATLALLAVIHPGGWADAAGGLAGGLFLSIPAALVGVVFLHLDTWLPLAVGLVLFPRIYAYLANTIGEVSRLPHVLAARARGAGTSSILCRHVIPVALPEVAALAGVSVNLALGASVPIEVLCDHPGIGQLAWQAALGRDLPLLVGLTWIAATLTLTANAAGGSVRLPQGRQA